MTTRTTCTTRSDRLAGRAAWEARHGRPYLALSLYWDAWEGLPEGERALAGPGLLHAALDIALDYLEQDAPETRKIADALIALAEGGDDDGDGRALSVRGMWRSVRARGLFREGRHDAAWQHALDAEHDLLAAIAVADYDTEAWGSLGGLYKRLAEWSDALDDDGKAEHYRKSMLEAYEMGSAKAPNAYQLLNYLEYRAVLDRRAPLVRTDDERERLDRALRLRRRQWGRGEDAPWAAFDLARGQHYMKPNVPRFLHDLGVAVEDTRRAARTTSDRWMAETAVKSLRDLFEAGVVLDGLEEGLLLVQRSIMDDGWVAGSWGALGRPEEFLTADLRAAQERLVQLQDALVREGEQKEQIYAYIARAERRWSEEEEERFQGEIDRFKRDIEPTGKKSLRVLYRVFGRAALDWAASLGAIPAAASLVARYLAERAAGRP